MSTVLTDSRTGAQLLPRVQDERATTPEYAAHLCCDADQRRHPDYATLAKGLTIKLLEDQ